MPIDNERNENWYTRSIFSVSSIPKSLEFYCSLLGFEEAWKYEDGGEIIVAQVNKAGFELILAANLDRVGQGRVFISLDTVDLESLEKLLKQKHITSERIYWGYPTILVNDPDGNEMLFPFPTED